MSWGCLTGLTYTIKLLQVQQEMQLSSACFWERRLRKKKSALECSAFCCEQNTAPVGTAVPFDRGKLG